MARQAAAATSMRKRHGVIRGPRCGSGALAPRQPQNAASPAKANANAVVTATVICVAVAQGRKAPFGPIFSASLTFH